MKKIFNTMVMLVFLLNPVIAQKFKIGFQTGIGDYAMSGLKNINSWISDDLLFDTKLVSDFPSYLYYRPSAVLMFRQVSLGLTYTFQSTGSRISGKDYSGEYRFDMQVKSNCPGFYFDVNIYSASFWKVTLYSTLGLTFSKLDLNEYFSLSDTVLVDDTYTYKAMNYYAEPGLNLCYSIKFISIGLNTGYFIPFGKQAFYTDDNKEHTLRDTDQQPVKPDWKGFRVGLSLFYTFNTGREKSSSTENPL